jgi:hypothetical protein
MEEDKTQNLKKIMEILQIKKRMRVKKNQKILPNFKRRKSKWMH